MRSASRELGGRIKTAVFHPITPSYRAHNNDSNHDWLFCHKVIIEKNAERTVDYVLRFRKTIRTLMQAT